MRKLLFALFLLAPFAVIDDAYAQKTCTQVASTPPTIPQQICSGTLDWVAPVADATHGAAVSYQIRRSDGGSPKIQIGTVNAPIVTLQNTFTDSGNVAHCWDVTAVGAKGDSSPPSVEACWTTPAIIVVVPPPAPGMVIKLTVQ